MARPSPWQLSRQSYPYSVGVPPRYSDLDTMGHINNVAIAAMFETGRVAFHQEIDAHPRDMGARWLVAAVNINYLAEMHVPHVIDIAVGVGRLGTRSWTILSAAFQAGECCATSECVMVAERGEIGADLRARMAPYILHSPAIAG